MSKSTIYSEACQKIPGFQTMGERWDGHFYLERLPQQLQKTNDYSAGWAVSRVVLPAYSAPGIYPDQALWLSLQCFKEKISCNYQSCFKAKSRYSIFWAAMAGNCLWKDGNQTRDLQILRRSYGDYWNSAWSFSQQSKGPTWRSGNFSFKQLDLWILNLFQHQVMGVVYSENKK